MDLSDGEVSDDSVMEIIAIDSEPEEGPVEVEIVPPTISPVRAVPSGFGPSMGRYMTASPPRKQRRRVEHSSAPQGPSNPPAPTNFTFKKVNGDASAEVVIGVGSPWWWDVRFGYRTDDSQFVKAYRLQFTRFHIGVVMSGGMEMGLSTSGATVILGSTMLDCSRTFQSSRSVRQSSPSGRFDRIATKHRHMLNVRPRDGRWTSSRTSSTMGSIFQRQTKVSEKHDFTSPTL